MYTMKNQTILLLLFTLLMPTSAFSKMVKWTDEQGITHYGPYQPPDQIKHGRHEITGQGILSNPIPKELTPEERAKAKQEREARLAREKIINEKARKEKAIDDILLKSYFDEKSIIKARDGQLAIIDANITVYNTNIKRTKKRIRSLIKDAAEYEGQGKLVPKHLDDNIKQRQKYLQNALANIAKKQEQKQTIRDTFQRNLERFRVIKARQKKRRRGKSQ